MKTSNQRSNKQSGKWKSFSVSSDNQDQLQHADKRIPRNIAAKAGKRSGGDVIVHHSALQQRQVKVNARQQNIGDDRQKERRPRLAGYGDELEPRLQ